MEELEEDVKFIADETLDFGELSPSDSREEEDITAVVTPEKPLRRGLSHRSDVNAVAPAPQGLRLSLGPLSPKKLEEILDEANRLAAQLEQCSLQEPPGAGSTPRRVKPSPRRETFVLKDSPVRDLLPTVSSSGRSTPHSSSLTPRLGSSDRKGSARALHSASGKKALSTKRESPTCNLFPASKSPASLARSTPPNRSTPPVRPTPPIRGRAGPSGRVIASEKTWAECVCAREQVELQLALNASPVPLAGPPNPLRPTLALQPTTNNSQRLARPQGAAAKASSRLPIPSAIPRPASRVPLAGRSVPPARGAPPPEALPARRGLPRPCATGHRVPVPQRPNLPGLGSARSNLQPLRKGATSAAPAR
ncbi:proline/serine-rich coiled-coil protein 1 isoform X1 [Sorex araneus]|uniref:proline/serine-rich coiled-coil protein 1 isoform X1 n=1 Tax=Sorex araneus TaxID=42254 RepID=UPI002433AB5E|nr:proline/serine-rich coiled-coil protein 1 isoform X1 [Sorex araneus]XP_054995073.1 proline/serine-rich coiled-coil protein 1 isoform X1 [Sorex araneus]XP_054995074.1 proline/serine-rich coiled-coil protein 1 isoform X1 [Sorex araneus]